MFAQRRKRITTHFSERIPVVKGRISVMSCGGWLPIGRIQDGFVPVVLDVNFLPRLDVQLIVPDSRCNIYESLDLIGSFLCKFH